MNPVNRHSSSDPACAALRPWLPDLADGLPLPAEAEALAAHLPGCPACQAELAELRTLFADLDALPAEVPPLALRDNFLAMLAAEKATLAAAAPAPGLTAQRGDQPLAAAPKPAVAEARAGTQQWLRIAASVALVAVGAMLGLLLRGGQPAAQVAVAPVQQAPALATQLAAAVQRPAAATDRLRLVAEAPAAVVAPGDPAVAALINTLSTDPNPNVRLAACEALYRLRADPRVGPALVAALPMQTDPNVQITLIETLVALREKRAVPQLEQLSQQPEVLRAVRQQAEAGIGQLI
ncbi:HEAT repeat domain-containing protein [Hymenobacter nivis]|uniref:HEAT repeat domain-containing protein n=1 Tax=Hymenobacter nivis TaxID=1850093 RepID=A0A502GY85_9BACT|nr:HEAT repeat domain-containing protein [Hymenobacter nivis]TPG67367.1 HEAT repeat domain-containing protein [Hymenobacter nivis]